MIAPKTSARRPRVYRIKGPLRPYFDGHADAGDGRGLETTRFIRAMKELRVRVPIIAMTANAFKEDIERRKAAGMNAHAAKPIDMETSVWENSMTD
jgi:CheY-like chemotaxis protein